MIFGVINGNVAVFLSSETVRSLALSASVGLPDNVRIDKMTGDIDDEVAVLAKRSQIILVG